MSKDSNLSLERIRKALAKYREETGKYSVSMEIFPDGSGYLNPECRDVEFEAIDGKSYWARGIDIVDWVEQMLPGPESEPDKIWTTKRFCKLLEDLSEVAGALGKSIQVANCSRVALGTEAYRSPDILCNDVRIISALEKMNERTKRYQQYLELKKEFDV